MGAFGDAVRELQEERDSPLKTFIGKKREEAKRERGLDELPPDPMDIHASRSQYAQRQDEARDARVTTDPVTYASDPNSYDFPGVDTGPLFEQGFGSNLSADRLDTVEEQVDKGNIQKMFDSVRGP